MLRATDVRRRTGPIVNAAALAALVAVLALVALVSRPDSPPSVAEFAPQAVEQINDAPGNQSSQFGSGGGEGTGGSADERTRESDDLSSIDVARVRRCVGKPPRQTEDPHSPPCVPYFEGNNGGATATGVTRDEIRIVVPQINHNFLPPAGVQALVSHFNNRYEFYGRKLELSYLALPPPGGTPQGHIRAAREVSSRSPFASTHYFGGDQPYYEELARQSVIAVISGEETLSEMLLEESFFAKNAPYIWGTFSGYDERLRALGDLSCTALAGRPARWAGPQYRVQTRRFGAFVDVSKGYIPNSETLREELARCGETLKIVEFSPDAEQNNEHDQAVASMSVAGITSVTCICRAGNMQGLLNSMGEYRPEWLMSGMGYQDVQGTGTNQSRENWLGITSWPKVSPHPHEPWHWAVVEGGFYPEPVQGRFLRSTYRSLLVLASGIQGAGPRLTPKTFEQALEKMTFPNPNAGAAPYWQQGIGFRSGDHTWVNDHALRWWSDGAEAYDPDAHVGDIRQGGAPQRAIAHGSWCYVSQGARWSRGAFPADADSRFFDVTKPCR